MRYQISGKHIDVGASLQQHVKDGVESIIQKYAERPTEAIVTFSKNGYNFVCEATVHLAAPVRRRVLRPHAALPTNVVRGRRASGTG